MPHVQRFNITTKSPQTGGIVSSNSGSSFGIMLKKAVYDGLIVRGKAPSPVYIEIGISTFPPPLVPYINTKCGASMNISL